MPTKREDIIAALELALQEILRVDKLNVWVSVRERSIVKILQEVGVTKDYSSSVMVKLKEIGLIETEGANGFMKYRIVTNVIPDVHGAAVDIYNIFLEKKRSYFNSDKLSPTRPSDGRPKYSKTKTMDDFEQPGKVVKCKRKIVMPQLGDMRYMVNDNHIKQVRIIGIEFGSDEKILCKVSYRSTGDEQTTMSERSGVLLNEIFETPEQVAAYLVKTLVKYDKPSIK
jgi:hypothetical protein